MKIIAVGMNYVAHCHELHADEKLPEEPVIFMKPDSALLKDSKPFFIPDFSQQVDYETELVVRINRLGKNIAPRFASRYYDAVTVGIDFTARDLHTIPCRVQKGDFAPGWLGYYMNSDLFHNQILPYITGIKVSSISKGAISETLILVPPFDEQEKIVQSLNEVQLLMTAETKVVNKIKFVKNGCLSKMFPQKDDPVPEMRLPGFTAAWEQRKLGEIVEFYNGDRSSRYPNDSDMVSEGVPFINAGDLISGRVKLDTANKITEEKFNELSGAKIQRGDIIYCLRGTLGKNAFVDNFDVGTVASSLVDIRPKKVVGKYLYQVLNSDIEYTQRTVNDEGAAQPNLSAKNLSLFNIPVPDEVEQEKIAAYFDDLDHLITLHQRKCDKYSNIKKGMMNDLLTGKIRLV